MRVEPVLPALALVALLGSGCPPVLTFDYEHAQHLGTGASTHGSLGAALSIDGEVAWALTRVLPEGDSGQLVPYSLVNEMAHLNVYQSSWFTIRSDGVLLVMDFPDLVAYQPDTTEIWRTEVAMTSYGKPALYPDDRLVYSCYGQGYAPQLCWIEPDGTISRIVDVTHGTDTDLVLGDDGSIFYGHTGAIGSEDPPGLVSYDSDGVERWHADLPGAPHELAVGEGAIYVTIWVDDLLALDRDTGEMLWHAVGAGNDPVLGVDGEVFTSRLFQVGEEPPGVWAHDRETGDLLWALDESCNSGAVGTRGFFYTACNIDEDPALIAATISPAGTVHWSRPDPHGGSWWTYFPDEPAPDHVLLAGDGAWYIGGTTHSWYKGRAELADTPWPTTRGDQQRTNRQR